jgi:hypothetical protein
MRARTSPIRGEPRSGRRGRHGQDGAETAAGAVRCAGRETSIGAADVDLIAAAGSDGVVWQNEGFGLAGRRRSRSDRTSPRSVRPAAAAGVAGRLTAIEHSDDLAGAGTGAIALEALPFRAGRTGHARAPRGRPRLRAGLLTSVLLVVIGARARAACLLVEALMVRLIRAFLATSCPAGP